MKKKIARTLIVLAPAALLVGCNATAKKGESLDAIRLNPAPGLNTENERYTDVRTDIDLVNNDNMRKFHSDNLRFWLWDRPSRLSPAPSAR